MMDPSTTLCVYIVISYPNIHLCKYSATSLVYKSNIFNTSYISLPAALFIFMILSIPILYMMPIILLCIMHFIILLRTLHYSKGSTNNNRCKKGQQPTNSLIYTLYTTLHMHTRTEVEGGEKQLLLNISTQNVGGLGLEVRNRQRKGVTGPKLHYLRHCVNIEKTDILVLTETRARTAEESQATYIKKSGLTVTKCTSSGRAAAGVTVLTGSE
jgi:hypothetical protein